MATIAVLITVFNRKEKTLECLKELYSQESIDGLCVDVFLTDDGSTDGTADAVKKEFPKVRVIQGDGTLFWNRGMLNAWKHAAKTSPDYYLWLNNDTQLYSNCLKILLESSLKKNDKSIIVGTTVEAKDSEKYSYGGRKLSKKYPIVRPSENNLMQCDIFNGNIVLIPKYVFESVGYNDSYYRHSFGDFDYGIMAMKKDVRSFVAPGILGFCKRNNPILPFQRKCNSIFKRVKILYSPLGHNPFEDFHFQRKFHTITYSILHFIKLHINIFFTKDHTKFQ